MPVVRRDRSSTATVKKFHPYKDRPPADIEAMFPTSDSDAEWDAEPSPRSKKTAKTTAYDPSFEQHLIDYGYYSRRHKAEMGGPLHPTNMDALKSLLAGSHASLSMEDVDEALFQSFVETHEKGSTEPQVFMHILRFLLGACKIPYETDRLFNKLAYLTEKDRLRQPKPDFYDGVSPIDLPAVIRARFGVYILPCTATTLPCLPNFFVEGKSSTGSAKTCERQVLYDLSLGSRGLHKLRKHVDKDVDWHNHEAYTIGATYEAGEDCGTLRLFTMHPFRSAERARTEYRMTSLGYYPMCLNFDFFEKGIRAFRNARLWARDQRQHIADLSTKFVLHRPQPEEVDAHKHAD